MEEKTQGDFIPIKHFEPFKFEIVLNGYEFYWDIRKLNWLQKMLLRLLGIKITKYKEEK